MVLKRDHIVLIKKHDVIDLGHGEWNAHLCSLLDCLKLLVEVNSLVCVVRYLLLSHLVQKDLVGVLIDSKLSGVLLILLLLDWIKLFLFRLLRLALFLHGSVE